MTNDYRITRDAGVVAAITLSEAKDNLAIASAVTQFDALLTALIKAATEFVEDQTSHLIKSQEVTLVKSCFGSGSLYVPWGPIISVGSVNYTDAEGNPQPVDPADYVIADRLPGRLDPVTSWPSTIGLGDGATVKYTAGYAAGLEPETAKQAVNMLTAHWFLNRSETQPAAVNDVPLAVSSLLNALQTGQDFIGF